MAGDVLLNRAFLLGLLTGCCGGCLQCDDASALVREVVDRRAAVAEAAARKAAAKVWKFLRSWSIGAAHVFYRSRNWKQSW